MIYILTTIDPGYSDWEQQAVGIFTTFEDAERCVLGNVYNIHDNTYYQYALIEGLEFGLYPHLGEFERYWYEWIKDPRHDDGGYYIACDCPEPYDKPNVLNVFSIT